jgi:hypothetical protein
MVALAREYVSLVGCVLQEEIAMAKSKEDDDEDGADDEHGLVYPEFWGQGWNCITAGCQTFVVGDIVEGRNKQFFLGMQFFRRVQMYLNELIWPTEDHRERFASRYKSEHGIGIGKEIVDQISFIELAADFEASTNTRLPVALPGRRKSGDDRNFRYELPDACEEAALVEQDMLEKGRIFQGAIKAIERKLEARITAGNTVKVRSLRSLGAASWITGLNLRPKLLRGDVVYKILKKYFWWPDHYANLHGYVAFIGHGDAVIHVPSLAPAALPTQGKTLRELESDMLMNHRSIAQGLHTVRYEEGTVRGKSQLFYCQACGKSAPSSGRNAFALLACAGAARPEGTSIEDFAASQAAAKVRKTLRSRPPKDSTASTAPKGKRENAISKWVDQIALLNSLPNRHRLPVGLAFESPLQCLACEATRPWGRRKEFLEATCVGDVSLRGARSLAHSRPRSASAPVARPKARGLAPSTLAAPQGAVRSQSRVRSVAAPAAKPKARGHAPAAKAASKAVAKRPASCGARILR